MIVVAALVIAVVAFKRKSGPAPVATQSPQTSVTPASSPSSSSKVWTITYTKNGTDITNLTIKVGDTVIFINQDGLPHWPASDPHPIHTICPGFDALRSLAKGESYSYAFKIVKTCPFHDHLNPSVRGRIIITQ